MNDDELKLISHRMHQRPCRYKQSASHAERKGIITGVNEHRRIVQVMDSYTGETFMVPAELVKEVALFGPEDMPSKDYLRGYFS